MNLATQSTGPGRALVSRSMGFLTPTNQKMKERGRQPIGIHQWIPSFWQSMGTKVYHLFGCCFHMFKHHLCSNLLKSLAYVIAGMFNPGMIRQSICVEMCRTLLGWLDTTNQCRAIHYPRGAPWPGITSGGEYARDTLYQVWHTAVLISSSIAVLGPRHSGWEATRAGVWFPTSQAPN